MRAYKCLHLRLPCTLSWVKYARKVTCPSILKLLSISWRLNTVVTNHCLLCILVVWTEAYTHNHLIHWSIVDIRPATVNAALKLCRKIFHYIFCKVSWNSIISRTICYRNIYCILHIDKWIECIVLPQNVTKKHHNEITKIQIRNGNNDSTKENNP